MPLSEPGWWYKPAPDWQAHLLAPAAKIYGAVSGARMSRLPQYRSQLPVICIGNFTAGGTGKTPLALTIAGLVRTLRRTPVFLSRGYGGRAETPQMVDANAGSAGDVGDEPLLLAREAMTVVAKNREDGARYIEMHAPPGAVILMDDGLQNPALYKDYKIAVLDSRRLIGNGYCIPAGPLRAPIETQLAIADAVFVAGTGTSAAHALLDRYSFEGLRVQGQVAPSGNTSWLQGTRVLAFAGIANPTRFFDLLRQLGASIAVERLFADHHFLSEAEAAALLAEAARANAQLVTTAKDAARLKAAASGPCAELKKRAQIVEIAMSLDGESERQLTEALARRITRA